MPETSKTKNVLKNLIGTVIYQACTILVNIVVLNLFLRQYGSEVNGLVSTLNQIQGYIALLEAGLGVTAIQALYKPMAIQDYDKVNTILKAATNYYNKTAVAYAICIVFVGAVLTNVLSTDIPRSHIFLMMVILAVPTLMDYLFQGKIRIMLTADQDVFIINVYNAVTLIITGVCRIFLIKMNVSYILVQSAFIIFTACKIILLKSYYDKRYKWLNLKVNPDKEALKQKNANLVHQIAGLVVNGTDAIVISTFLGLKYASIYSVYSIVFSALSTFMWQFSNSATPSFGHYMVRNDEKELRKVFLDLANGFYIMTFSVYSVAYLMIVPFIDLYTVSVTDINYRMEYLPLFFVVIGISNCIRIPSNSIINAAGFFEKTKNRAILEAVINITVSIVCVQFIGIYGVLIGTICSFLYRTVDIILFTNKYIIRNVIKKQVGMIVLDLLITIVFILLIQSINILNTRTWITMILSTGILLLAILTILLLVNYLFNRDYLVSNIRRVKTLLK